MKKISLITLLGLIPSVTTLSSCATTPLAQKSVNKEITAEIDVPPELLDIDQGTKCLRGFASGVTVEQIRDKGYTRLVIPEDVTSIADYAFAYMFDGIATNIDKLVLNSSLTTIGTGAFTCCYGLRCDLNLDVTQVTSVGQDAFFYCTGLTGELKLPSSLKTIGPNAFKFCEHFTGTLSFPTELGSVGSHAFEKCIRINKIDFSNYDSIPNWLCQQNNIFFELGNKATEDKEILFNIKNNTESEWQSILKDRQNVAYDSFTIVPLKTTTENDFTYSDDTKTEIIGFNQSTNVDVIKIPSGVKKICEGAFASIKSIQTYKLVLNDELKEIEKNAFKESTSIVGSITLPNDFETLGESAFEKSGISGKLVIPNGVAIVPDRCFADTKIQSLTITQNIETLGKNCFSSSSTSKLHEIDVSSVTDGTSVSKLWNTSEYEDEEQPFYSKGGYPEKGVIITSDTQDIATNWISKFNNLGMTKTFEALDNRDWAIYAKDRLIKELPNGTADKAFAIKNNNEIVSLSKAYKNDPDFPKVYGLIKIPDKINKISANAFKDVKQFQSEKSKDFTGCPDLITPWYLSFNLGLIEIGDYAFKNCTGLTGRLVLSSTITKVGSGVFEGCSDLLDELTLPTSLTYIGDNAFKDTGFTTFILPTSLKYVGNGAFSSSNVTTIDLTSYGTSYHLNWLPTNGINDQIFNIQPANEKGKIVVQGNTSLWKDELLKYGLNDQWEIVNMEGGN